MAKWVHPKLVPGEYSTVSFYSADHEALKRAHLTPCSKEEARAIIAELTVAFQAEIRARALSAAALRIPMILPTKGDIAVNVVFGSRRGRGGWRHGRPFVSLPTKALSAEVIERARAATGKDYSVVGHLRIGLVLHEFAHIVAPLTSHHDKRFVQILDKLVVWWVRHEGGDRVTDLRDLAAGATVKDAREPIEVSTAFATAAAQVTQLTSLEECRQLQELVGQRFDALVRELAAGFRLGDRVEFHSRGLMVRGTVEAVNPKTVKVLAGDGTRWRVSPSLLRRVE
jgi:hypothetical protein